MIPARWYQLGITPPFSGPSILLTSPSPVAQHGHRISRHITVSSGSWQAARYTQAHTRQLSAGFLRTPLPSDLAAGTSRIIPGGIAPGITRHHLGVRESITSRNHTSGRRVRSQRRGGPRQPDWKESFAMTSVFILALALAGNAATVAAVALITRRAMRRVEVVVTEMRPAVVALARIAAALESGAALVVEAPAPAALPAPARREV